MINIEYILNTVEQQFLITKQEIIRDHKQKVVQNGRLSILEIARIGQYIRDIEKVIFLNNSINEINTQKGTINEYIDKYKVKRSKLKELVNCYANGFQENQIQFTFYNILINQLTLIHDGKHEGFSNIKSFLERDNIFESKNIEMPSGVITSKELENITPLKTLKSPEAIIVGFQKLIELNHCTINNLEAFVYKCFQFNNQYENGNNNFFYFKWDRKPVHALSNLFGQLKRRKSISSTHQEIANWIMALTNLKSAESIQKYCSLEKEISKKNMIDYQIFNL